MYKYLYVWLNHNNKTYYYKLLNHENSNYYIGYINQYNHEIVLFTKIVIERNYFNLMYLKNKAKRNVISFLEKI